MIEINKYLTKKRPKDMTLNLNLVLISIILTIVCTLDLNLRGRRKGKTLFHEDQDVLVTLIIVFPYYFPLWERFYNTSVEKGTEAAIAQFPNLPPGGLPSCGVFCRKRRSEAIRTGRFFEYDEQIIYFLIELIAAYPVPIIPNPYALANRKPVRVANGFTALPGLDGLRQVAGLFDNCQDHIN